MKNRRFLHKATDVMEPDFFKMPIIPAFWAFLAFTFERVFETYDIGWYNTPFNQICQLPPVTARLRVTQLAIDWWHDPARYSATVLWSFGFLPWFLT